MVDWGITWDEIEPYYTRADKLVGVFRQSRQHPRQADRGRQHIRGRAQRGISDAADEDCLTSARFSTMRRSRSAIIRIPIPPRRSAPPYTNPDGISRPGCFYCGFCDRFGCMIGAKAQPTNTLLPIVEKQKSVLASQRLLGAPHRVRQGQRRPRHRRVLHRRDRRGDSFSRPTW